MSKKSWLYVVAALVIVGGIVVAMLPCEDKPSGPEAPPLTALTPEM
jgi:hypothetical protein